MYSLIEPESTNLYPIEGFLITFYYFCENFYRSAPVSEDGEFVNISIVECW